MRFRLVEEPTEQQPNQGTKQVTPQWPPSTNTLKAYEKLDSIDDQVKFVNERIFPHRIFKELSGVQPIIMDSIQKLGLDPKRNFFLQFMSEINVPMPNNKWRPKVQYIFSSFLNKKMDLHMKVLKNPSLYDRSDREFQYTLNVFTLLSDKSKAASYIKDTSVIDLSQLFVSGDDPATSKIKPAGLNGGKGDTIFNVIEGWAKDNEYSPEEIANKVKWTYEYFKEVIERAFENRSGINLSLNDKSDYLERLFVTFSLKEIKPSNDDNTVKKGPKNITDKDVTKYGNPGNVDIPIYITSLENGNAVQGVFLFHKFVPLDHNSMSSYGALSSKNISTLQGGMKDVGVINGDSLQRVIGVIEKLSPIPRK